MLKNSSRFIPVSLILIAAVILLNACSFSAKTTERYYQKAQATTYDVVAVPGVPFTEAGWDSTMKARVYWAKHLYDRGIAKNIMFSGSSVYSPYYEGEIMALYAIALGIPKEHVFSETKAQHSTENLYYVYLKSKNLGFTKIALATDPFQAKQLKRFARLRIGENTGIIPIVFDTLRALQPFMTDPAIDYKKAYNSDFVSLKSRESFWKRLRGTMGKNIDYNAY
ncbi:MAG: YdcF family protein [Chitinophagaceae bacterium]|nr:YdcF family protein [Chitinophagaceae bacterium]MBK9485127.1 YdcF family protein [Chitinophagaceae bacterium]MBL0201538.1 YdcF family protein [Chitinophagaceae bacterium]